MISKPTIGECRTLMEQIRRAKDSDHVAMILVGNKADLEKERQIETEAGQELAKKYNCPYYETSAKTGQNVENIFNELVREVRRLKKFQMDQEEKAGKPGRKTKKDKKPGGCLLQ